MTDDIKIDVKPIKINNDKKKIKHKSKYLNDVHYRALLVGASGQGKTYLLLKLLPMLAEIDHLFIFSKTINQPVYRAIVEFFDKKGVNIYISEGLPNFNDIISENKQELKDSNTTAIFDDFNKKDMRSITEFYTKGRHYNINTLLLHQRLVDIPKIIRDNANLLILFPTMDNHRFIYQSFSSIFANYKEFQNILKKIFKKPYNFMMIDFSYPIPRVFWNFDNRLI